MDKSFYSLGEAAAMLNSQPQDLIHLAAGEEVVLLVGVPDGIRFRTYDASSDRTELPALLEPQLLALTPTQCQKIEINGRTEQSDFRVGYLIGPDGTLQRLIPSYGGRLYLDHGWAFWRTYRGPYIKEIELTLDRLFIIGDDVRRVLAAKSQPAIKEKPKKKDNKANEVLSAKSSSAVLSVDDTVQVDASDQGQEHAIAQVENAVSSTSAPPPDDAPAETPSKPLAFIRLKEVITRTGLSRSAIYDKLDPKSRRYDPSFPKQYPLGTNAVAWVEAEITRWVESRIDIGKR